MVYSLCGSQSRLPKRTNSQPAKQLHALLRYYPGYSAAISSPQRITWAIQSLCALCEDRPELFQTYLPDGCINAVYLLAAEVPFVPRFSKEVTLESLCAIVIHLASYCRFVGEINPEFFD